MTPSCLAITVIFVITSAALADPAFKLLDPSLQDCNDALCMMRLADKAGLLLEDASTVTTTSPPSCPFRQVPHSTADADLFCGALRTQTECGHQNITEYDCTIKRGCCWNPEAEGAPRCTCPGGINSHVNFRERSYNQATDVTTFHYGITCQAEDASVTSWGFFAEPGLQTADETRLWKTDFLEGRHLLKASASVQCPGKAVLQIALRGNVGSCSGQTVSWMASGGYAVGLGAVPCRQPDSASGVQPAIASKAASPSIVPASKVARTALAGQGASTIETVMTFAEKLAVDGEALPATRSMDPTRLAETATQELDQIRKAVSATASCADLPALVLQIRKASHRYATGFSALALKGVRAGDAMAAAQVSTAFAAVFAQLIDHWTKQQRRCPKAIKPLAAAMQVASEEWVHMYAVFGAGGLDAAILSSSEWAQAFIDAADGWHHMTAHIEDDLVCKSVPGSMKTLEQVVSSVTTSVHAWVAYFSKINGQDDAEVHVMKDWLRPMEVILAHAKTTSLMWSHDCTASGLTVQQSQAAAAAVANFISDFSRRSLRVTQEWVQAFASCSPQCGHAVEQASIQSSGVIHMSDIAQVSTAWSLAFSGTDSAAATSAKWSQTYASLIRDVQAQSLTWSAALRTASGSEPGVTVTSASNAWASSLQLLSVSFAVAAEGWLQTSQEHGSAKWAESAGALVRAAGEAAQGWAEVLPPINLDQGATTRALHSSNVWARALDGMVANTINIAQVVRQGLSMEVSSQWAEACGSMQEGVRIGAFAWMSLLERHNDTDLLAGGDSTEGALESLITALVDSSAGTVDIGMKLVADETYDVWSLAIDQALAIGEDAPLDAASHAFAGSLEEAMRHFAHLPGNPSSIQLRDHICSQAPSLVICSKQSEM